MSKHKKKKFCDTLEKDIILDRLYQCRELEITTQWQRSVFLAAFIILLFTGYAKLIELFFSKHITCLPFHWTGLILAFLIFIFGILWLAMAKGSKRWTDIYRKNYNDNIRPSSTNDLYCYKKDDL